MKKQKQMDSNTGSLIKFELLKSVDFIWEDMDIYLVVKVKSGV